MSATPTHHPTGKARAAVALCRRAARLAPAPVRRARGAMRPAALRRSLIQVLCLLLIAQPNYMVLGAINASAASQERQLLAARGEKPAGSAAHKSAADARALNSADAGGGFGLSGAAGQLAAGLSGFWDQLAGTGAHLLNGIAALGGAAQQTGVATPFFGPRKFTRRAGAPVTEVERFALPADFTGPFTINIQNGEPGGANRVSSATVKLNGVVILTPNDINQNVPGLSRAVTLAEQNTLEVRLASQPNSFLIINIQGVRPDRTPPALAITAPADGSRTTDAAVVVSGTAADTGAGATGLASVEVNGRAAVYNPETGTWSVANLPLSLGANELVARATDKAGNQSQARVTVTREEPPRDTTAPALAITSPADGLTTTAETVTVSGTVGDPGPNASGVARVTVGGVEAARDVLSGTWSLAGVRLAEGPNTITAQAADNAGNVTNKSVTVTRQPAVPPDTTAPVVRITSPLDGTVVYDSPVTVTGTAADEGANATGVRRVVVNGVEATYNAAAQSWTATGVSLAEGENLIRVEAEDNATPTPNRAGAEVRVMRRNVEPPTLTITSPQQGAVLAQSFVTVAGQVRAGAPDVTVAVAVNGEPATVAGGQFTKTVALLDGSNTINVVATDSRNQSVQSSVTVTSDRTPPVITLQPLPVVVQPGESYVLRAEATDDTGVAAVEFSVNGRHAATVTAAPFEFTLAVPAGAPGGDLLEVSAVARDAAGATAVASERTRVAGPGGISGYVFDDSTGYVLGDVRALLGSAQVAATQADGTYNFVSTLPRATVRFVRDGYTPVERSFEVAAGVGTALFDARLTPLDATANVLASGGGSATGDGGRLRVIFGEGSFAAGTDVRVTSVSPQGLVNLLPFGWSPVPGAVVDVRAASGAAQHPSSFVVPARLRAAAPALPAGLQLVLARYDETSRGWTVVDASVAPEADGTLAAQLPGAGQYAFLVADAGASAPPPVAAGQALTSGPAAQSAALDAATGAASASPRTAVVSPQAKSTITVVVTSPGKLPSGVAVEVSFDETYNLLSSKNPLYVDRPTQDFVLYAYPPASAEQPNRLGASFVAKPTRADLTVAQLRMANVHVTIRSGRTSTTGVLVGTQGGRVTADDGSELIVAPGALTSDAAVFLEEMPAESLGLQLPAGYEVLKALSVETSGATFATGARLSIPAEAGDNSRIIVARVVSAGWWRAPRVVARAVEEGGMLRSTTAAPIVPQGVSLPGVTTGGRYVFIRVPHAFGYVQGTVSSAAGPVAGAMVTNDRTPFIDLTAAGGRYLVVGAADAGGAGQNTLDAASLTTDETGAATAALGAQDAVAESPIAIGTTPLSVATVSPASGATGVVVTSPVTLTFSKPVAAATLTGSSFRVTTAAGLPVIGSVTVMAGNRVAVFTPGSTLAAGTAYKVQVGGPVLDLYGRPLAAPFESTFTTAAAVTADNRLRPERIRIGYPDAQGFATVHIPAGAVPLSSVVIAINNLTGATVTAVAGPGELTLRLQAEVGDEIVLLVRQPDGTEYRVSQAAYRRADGVTSVGPNGGAVTSEDGSLVLEVPKDAVRGQAQIRLTPKDESHITTPRGELEGVPFGGGVEIKAEGDFTIEKELHLELPAPAGMEEGRRVAFMSPQKITFEGREVETWQTVTSGRVEDGKFRTSSPPFFGLAGGLLASILVVYVFAPVTKTVVYGNVTDRATGKGVPSVLCLVNRTDGGGINPAMQAGAITTLTNKDGHYAVFDFVPSMQDGRFVTAIDDRNSRRGYAFAASMTTIEGMFLQGLQGYLTLHGNIELPPVGGEEGVKPAPSISVLGQRLQLQPGQEDSLPTHGVAPVGSPVRITAKANTALAEISGQLIVGGLIERELSWVPDQDHSYYTDFTLPAEGSYTVRVKGATVANEPRSTTTVVYNFISLRNPNTRPPLAGPPRVIMSTPADGSVGVDMTTDLKIEFSEPVRKLVPGGTVYVEEAGTGQRLGGTITSGGITVGPDTPNVSSIIFKPSPALLGGKGYCVNVSSEVVDDTGLALDQDYSSPDDASPQPFKSCFQTFNGMVLTPEPVADSGERIAAAGQYVYTVSNDEQGRSKLSAYDVTEPHVPALRSTLPLPQRAWSLAAAEAEGISVNGRVYNRLVVVATNSMRYQEQYATLWVVSFDNISGPEIVGITSLFLPQVLPANSIAVRIHDGRAYIGNIVYRGTMVVDLARSISLMQSGRGRAYNAPAGLSPVAQAATFFVGYGHAAKVQSVLFNDDLEGPSSAMDVSVLNQTVLSPSFQGDNVRGTMPVGYVVDSLGHQLLTIGYPKQRDGSNTPLDLNGDTFDERILARNRLEPTGKPMRVRAVSNVLVPRRDASGAQVGTKLADLAIVANHQRFWVFDVTMAADVPAIAHRQYPSKSFAELDPELTGGARNFEVEGTLAYVTFGDRVAIIDFSDPGNLRVIAKIGDIGTNNGPIAVKDGFVYTLAPGGVAGTGELRVSIARPASLVFVRGRSGNPELTCANPVIVDRQTKVMRQSAEVIFQLFGQQAASAAMVTIRKNGVPVATIPATLTPGSNERVATGRALWTSGEPVDLNAAYTAEVGVNAGQPGEHNSTRAPIPFSFLITDYQPSIGFPVGELQRNYGYVLGTNAALTFEINGAAVVGGEPRTFGLNVERLALPALAAGRYPFTLRAVSLDDPSLTDQVSGVVDVAAQSESVRRPGSTVVNDVDLGTGSLGLTTSDADVRFRGVSLAVTRSYNSGASNVFSPFGYGWHHNFQVLLVHDTTRKHYTLFGGDGGGQIFKEGSAEMKAEKPHHGTLLKNADGSFDFYTKARVRYHFPGALDRDAYSYHNQAYVGNLEFVEDANRNRVTLEYDEQGRMTRAYDPAGRELRFDYELAETPFAGVLAPTADAGRSTACAPGMNFSVLRNHLVKAQVGKAWRVKAITGPGGLRLEYEYDGHGNLVKATRKGTDGISQATSDGVLRYSYGPDGGAQTAYDTTHLLVSATDPNGNVTSYEYNRAQLGLPVARVTRPEGVKHDHTYTFESGKVVRAVVTDGNGQSSTYQLDNGYTQSITGPMGAVTTMSFNDEGLKTSETDPEGMRTDYGYDAKGNLTLQHRTGGGVSVSTSATYDQTFAKPLTQTDANGKTTTYALDGRGNVTAVNLPTGRSVRMTYSGSGDLMQLTDERGFVTSFGYDAFGNQSSSTVAGEGGPVTTTSRYDERNRVVSAGGTLRPAETHTYDALDHLVGHTAADPAGVRQSSSTSGTYKPGGQLISSVTTGGGQSLSRQYAYDGLNRVTQVVETASGADTFTLAYAYDRNSNLLSQTDRRGVTTAHAYNELNFRTSDTVTGPHGGTFVTSYERDKVGGELSVTDIYGQTTKNLYDGLHRLVGRQLPGGYTEGVALDGNGNVLSSKDRNGRETTFAYDEVNRPTSRRDPAGRVITWTYDDANSTVVMRKTPQNLTVTARTDALRRPAREQVSFAGVDYSTSYLYSGLTVEVTDPRGVKTTKRLSAFGETGGVSVGDASAKAEYSAFGAVDAHTDANGRKTVYTTDALGRTTAADYPGDFSESWSYDGGGLPLSHTDRRGVAEAMAYDNIGRLLTRKVGATNVLAVSYGAAGDETRADARGHQTSLRFDGLRRLVSLTNADGKTKSLRYDGVDLLGVTDFKGLETKYQYDAVSRVTNVTDRSGRADAVGHSDAGGHVKTVMDRRGNTRVESYDPLGRLVSVTVAGERVAFYEYDGANNRTAETDGRGKRTAYVFDDFGRVRTVNRAGGQVETLTHDKVGNVLTYNDGFGGDVTRAYDELDHLLSETDGAGNATTYRHDGEGLLVERTEPEGGRYTYVYNDLRSLTGVTDPAGAWVFGYDPNQNLTGVRDPRGHATAYGYDALDRLKSVAQPLVPATSLTYDENDNLLTVTDAKGQTASFGYDALDRMTAANYPASLSVPARLFSFGYDPVGNLTSVSETGGTTRGYARTYDARDRVASETDPFGRASAYGYDGADNVTSYTDASGRQTGYTYDDANRLATAVTAGGTATYAWNPDGLLKQVSYPGGMKRAYDYDAADRIKSVVNTVGGGQTEEYAYGYDRNSNRVGESRKFNGAQTRSAAYGFDLLNRLTSASYTQGGGPAAPTTSRVDYTYDPAGNRLTARGEEPGGGGAVNLAYTYDALNRLTQVSGYAGGAFEYEYDNNGNLLTTKQGGALRSSYEYDSRDQLRRVADGTGTEQARYDYDFLRRRLTRNLGGQTTQYAYWGDRLTNEFDETTRGLRARYDFGGGGPVRGELGAEGERWYFSDALGSVTALSSLDTQTQQASMVAGYEYTAWGAQLTSGASSNAFGYTGQRLDAETGLMGLGNGERYYSPQLGRFTQQDSWTGALAATQTLNRYAYANSNPLRFTDPTGHWPDWRGIGEHARESYSLFQSFSAGVIEGIGQTAVGMARLGVGLATRPRETLRATGQGIKEWANDWREIIKDPDTAYANIKEFVAEDPHEAMRILGNAGGELIGGELAGMAVAVATRGVSPALGRAAAIAERTAAGRAVAGVMREGGKRVTSAVEPLANRAAAAAEFVRTRTAVGRVAAEGWQRANAPITRMFSREAAEGGGASVSRVEAQLAEHGDDLMRLAREAEAGWGDQMRSLRESGGVLAMADDAARAAPGGITLQVRFRPGMDLKEFNRKVNRLRREIEDGNAFVNLPTGVTDAARKAATRSYRTAVENRINSFYKDNPAAKANALRRLGESDIDHILDLQLGGGNVPRNMKSLHSRTNQGLGSQIWQQLRHHPKGTPVVGIEVVP